MALLEYFKGYLYLLQRQEKLKNFSGIEIA